MKSGLVIGLLLVVVGIGGYRIWSQGQQIDALTQALHGGPSADAAGDPKKSNGDLIDRVRALETQVRLLRARTGLAGSPVVAGEHGGSMPRGVDPTNPSDSDALFDDAENAVMEALESYNPQIRDRLRAVVQEEQEQLREERMQQRRERWEERSRERLAALAQGASLSSDQHATLGEWLNRERDQITELFAQARRDFSFGEARDKAVEIREETDAQVRELLDEDQLTAYQAMRTEEVNRRFGFGRPRPPPEAKKPAD